MKQKNPDQDCKTVEETLLDDNSKDESLSDHESRLLSEPSDEKTELLIDQAESSTESNTSKCIVPDVSLDVSSDKINDETETLIDILKGETPSLKTDDTPDESMNDLPKQSDLSNFSIQMESPSTFSDVGDETTEQLTNESLPNQDKHRRKHFLIIGIAVGILIITALVFLIPAQLKASEIGKSLELGEKYLDEGKYEEAILAFNDVITIDDKQVKAYEGKGEANIGLKNYTEAETQLEAARAISETDNGSVLLADVYLNTNRKDQGKTLLDGVMSNQSSDIRVIVHASRLYGALNDHTTMINLLEKKIADTKDKDQLKKLFDELIEAYVEAGKSEAEILIILERAAEATGDSSYLDKKANYSVKKPNFGLASGEYQGTQNLELIKGNPSDKLYYTLDGSEPGITSTEYTTPITLQPGDITIKVIAVNEVGVKTPVQESKYAIKQNKLSNETFINQLYGYWYTYEPEEILKFSNSSCIFLIKTWSAGGNYQIVDTSENGGTIIIQNYCVEGTYPGPQKIEFDFGTPGDGIINCRFTNVNTGETFNWLQFTSAKDLGNNQYQLPTGFKSNSFKSFNGQVWPLN
ncbi:chitobiase/beta-hexosaminidase C-terminal domain-containing protein [Acetobacterium wieringae]|uniref:chitobiase/beta-hexosaminidase C-terminal domain-containing protein n=1 Tax=Acetobacterium wieringae TaxID=52694 RepID=UPI0031581F48